MNDQVSFTLRGRNPDVLTCIANLSNDVVRSYPARVGTPLVNTRSRFLKTASYGDTLAVHVTVKEWRDKSFVQAYRITREGIGREDAQGTHESKSDLIMDCEEVRIFAATRDDGKNSIRAVRSRLQFGSSANRKVGSGRAGRR